MCALLGKAWLQCRRLAGAYYSHFPFLLINGARTSREGSAVCWTPACPKSDWLDIRRFLGYHCLIGPVACWSYRQVIMANRAPPVWSDVKGGVAIVSRRAEISACMGHCGHAKPKIRG